MKKYNFTRTIKAMRNITLNKGERDSMRGKLKTFMAENPVCVPIDESLLKRGKFSLFGFSGMQLAPAFIALALVLSGGVAAAAEGSIPGDTLYGVKININEGLRSWFAVTDEQEAELSVELVERRLEETSKLILSGNINSETKSEISANIEMNTEVFKERSIYLQEEDRTRLNEKFDAVLKAHAAELDALVVSAESESQSIVEVEIEDSKDSGQKTFKSTINSQFNANTAESVLVLAEQMEEKAQGALSTLAELLNYPYNNLNAHIESQAEIKQKNAENTFASGEAALKVKDSQKAVLLFNQSIEEVEDALDTIRNLLDANLEVEAEEKIKAETKPVYIKSETSVTEEDEDEDEEDDFDEGLDVDVDIDLGESGGIHIGL